jgi:hypothetical protein
MTSVVLQVTSTVGSKTSNGVIKSVAPTFQTLQDLEGYIYTATTVISRLLSVEGDTQYDMTTYSTSTKHLFTITNYGNAPVSITSFAFTEVGVTHRASTTGTGWTANYPYTVPAGGSLNFNLQYYSIYEGEFNNSFVIVSNNDSGNYRVNTRQSISKEFDFTVSPDAFSTSTYSISEVASATFVATPTYPSLIQGLTIGNISADITGAGWSIANLESDNVTVSFDSNNVSNVNGTYPSVLSIHAGSVTHTVNNTAVVNIDPAKNKNYGSWLSPKSLYNSVIAMSYDLVDSVRVLTIGVGLGGAGRPIYGDASSTYDSILITGKTIGYLNRGDYWGTIYKIYLDGTARSYQSSESLVRTSANLAYERYFGNNESADSMFVVYDDGYGNLNVVMNRLSSFSDDDNVNATLNNLTRAFYYYSPIDSPARVTQLGAPKGDGTETDMFFGFDALGNVTTMLVPYPT